MENPEFNEVNLQSFNFRNHLSSFSIIRTLYTSASEKYNAVIIYFSAAQYSH